MKRINHIINHLDNHISNNQVISRQNVNDPTSTIPENYGGAFVAEVLKYEGVKTVFTLTGGHIAPILVGCNQAGIRVIDVRDEVTTVFAADAVSRITGIPGVAIVTAGPGLTNTITAVKNAQMAESAVIVMGGATSMLLKGRGSLQDIDQFALMKPHVKCCFTIKRVKDIIPTIQRAFYIASNGIPGPVFIEYPLETIWSEQMIRETSESDNKPKLSFDTNAILAYVADAYTKYHFNTVFKDAWDNPFAPLTKNKNYIQSNQNTNMNHVISGSGQYQSNFNPNSIKLIINQLTQKSEKPIIVLGSQSVLHPNLIDKLIESIEYLNIPIYLSGMARGLLGKYHNLHKRHKRSIALKECDLLILCGVSCDFRLDYGRGINNKAYLIMVNLDESKLKINTDLRKRNIIINGDSQAFILRLSETCKRFNLKLNYNDWMDTLNKREKIRETQIDKMRKPRIIKQLTNTNNNSERKDNDINNNNNNIRSYVDPIYCCRIIDEIIDDDSYIIADGGDFVGTASYIVKPRKPLRWLDPGAFGTLGCGAGFAMGVKSVSPNSEVWILYGDGSFGWSISEFDTMKRCKLPVIAVIGNDACWSQMYRDQIRLLKDPVATLLEYSNYEKCVEGLGCKGILIENENQLKDGLLKAKQYAKQGHPVVVNVLLGRSNFREGSLSL